MLKLLKPCSPYVTAGYVLNGSGEAPVNFGPLGLGLLFLPGLLHSGMQRQLPSVLSAPSSPSQPGPLGCGGVWVQDCRGTMLV